MKNEGKESKEIRGNKFKKSVISLRFFVLLLLLLVAVSRNSAEEGRRNCRFPALHNLFLNRDKRNGTQNFSGIFVLILWCIQWWDSAIWKTPSFEQSKYERR